MVDALVSGASAERRVGSSPILGTSKEFSFRKLLFCLPRIELGQLVAPLLQYLLCLLCSRLLPPFESYCENWRIVCENESTNEFSLLKLLVCQFLLLYLLR